MDFRPTLGNDPDWPRATPEQLRLAIGIYLHHAYPDALVPPAVRQRLDAIDGAGPDELYQSTALEPVPPDRPTRYNLRLGNHRYPNMKLVIERSPDGGTALFRADTHDRQFCPMPGQRDHDAFCQLIRENQQIAQQIESDWEQHGLPTFKTFLRQDLAKRGK